MPYSIIEDNDEPISHEDLKKSLDLHEQQKMEDMFAEEKARIKVRNKIIITILFSSIVIFTILVFILSSTTANHDTACEYIITYTAYLKDNDHVGSSWTKGMAHNDTKIRSGATVTDGRKLSITLWAEENDDISDFGSKTVTFKNLGVGEIEKRTVYVTVKENRGRYAGNTAVWEFTVTVKRTA